MAKLSVSDTLGGVTIHSTATITQQSRSGTSTKLNISITTRLNASYSFIGTGLSVVGVVTAYGVSKNITLKSSSSSWSGTSSHTTTTTMTITVPASINVITLRYKFKFDGETSTEDTASLTLSKILAKVTSVTSFSDTTNPKMYFSNPAGFKIRPYLNFYDKAGGTKLLTLYPSGMSSTGSYISSPYTWNITSSQRKSIRDKLKTRSKCYVAIGLNSYNSSGTNINSSSKGTTFTNVLKPPIFSDFSFIDSNPTTINLTGDSSKLIKGYSTLKITINQEQTPTAQNEATMSNFLIDGKSYSYTENFSVEIPNWNKKEIEVYAVDSRGISTKVSKTCEGFIEYEPLTKGNISAKRENDVGELTKLSYNGNVWNNSFGAISNTVTATYKYKVSDSAEFIDGTTTINPTVSESTFSFDNYILGDGTANGFLTKNSYQIDVTVKDALSEVPFSTILGSGIPAIAIYKNYAAFHGKYDRNLGGTQINGDLFLDGVKLREPSLIQFYKTADETGYSSSYNYFSPFNGDGEVLQSITIGTKLNLVKKTVSYGDRDSTTVYGIEIGKNVDVVRADVGVRYGNPNSSSLPINTYIYRRRDNSNTIYGSCYDTISTARYTGRVICDIPVQEGDFIFAVSYRGNKTTTINVLSDNVSTSMRVLAIG